MRVLASTVGLILLVLTTPNIIICQSPNAGSAHGSIEGQVALSGQPMSGATVILVSRNAQRSEISARSATDNLGHFRIEGVTPGSYFIDAFVPAFVASGSNLSPQERGKAVIVGEGEAVTGVEIALVRGGVITGRVVDSSRQPLINMSVNLTRLDPSGRPIANLIAVSDEYMYKTDDRGVYRIFGLVPGRYKVSVGVPSGGGAIRYKGGYYPLTFHPDVTDESKARIIELDEAREVGDADIVVASFAKTFDASGQIIDAGFGKGVSGLLYGYGAVSDAGQYVGTVGLTATRSTSKGKFLIDGLTPGRYAAYAVNEGDDEFYSEPTIFEITDSEVSDLKITVKRGASIRGMIAFEGIDAANALANVTKLYVKLTMTPPVLEAFRRDTIRITPDGRFVGVGLRPGKVSISVLGSIGGRNVTLSRIEHNGVEQQALELVAGEQVTGVKLVVSY
ncbi:MAG: carboxypeptidase-like regulatory domain-containing protein [Acidobacteriota bacterium]